MKMHGGGCGGRALHILIGSDEDHAPDVWPLVTIGLEAVWAAEPVWMLWQGELLFQEIVIMPVASHLTIHKATPTLFWKGLWQHIYYVIFVLDIAIA
jgi:hypothetical protein